MQSHMKPQAYDSRIFAILVRARIVVQYTSRSVLLSEYVSYNGITGAYCSCNHSVMTVQMITEAGNQYLLHCAVISTGIVSDHSGRRDVSSGGGHRSQQDLFHGWADQEVSG